MLKVVNFLCLSFYRSRKETEKDEQKQDAEKSSRPPSGVLQDCEGVRVEFHVVIHEEWKFDPSKEDKSVHIRFGTKGLGDWKWNCVDMNPLE